MLTAVIIRENRGREVREAARACVDYIFYLLTLILIIIEIRDKLTASYIKRR